MASVLAATKSQNTRILQLLLQGPTNTNDVQQALFYASQEGLADSVQCLIANGLDPDLKNNSGNSLLHLAVSEGHTGVVDVLCQAGVCVNSRGAGSNAPVHIAAKWGKDECLQVLLQNGCSVNIKDSTKSTALILAVKNKEYGAIRLLLDAGCDINAADRSGRTALHFAALSGTAVEQIIQAGADVNICDVEGCSPLLYAATEGLDRVIACLARVPDCNVNLANTTSGKSPLHILAYKGHHQSVRELMESGADPKAVEKEGRTAMWYAVANGHVTVAQVLLMYSFDIDSYKCQPNALLNTCPVQLAVDKCLSKILKLFILTHFDDQHMRECMHQGELQELFSDAKVWLSQGNQTTSLQHICRRWIRHQLKTAVISDIIHKLPVPNKFIDYILMKELEKDVLIIH